MVNYTIVAVAFLSAFVGLQSAQAPPAPATKPDLASKEKPDPFLRGYSVNVMCSGMHMRGKARLLRSLKRLEVSHGGETDSLASGVQGYVRYDIKNSAGKRDRYRINAPADLSRQSSGKGAHL